MRGLAVGIPWGLGLAVGLLVAACAPAPPPTAPTPTTAIPMPAPQAGTPAPAVATPAAAPMATSIPQVQGVRGTPVATVAPGAPSPGPFQVVGGELDQLSAQLQIWSRGTPGPDDLMDMMDRATMIADDLNSGVAEMSPQERRQALLKMNAVLGQMIQVIETHDRRMGPAGQLGGWMRPPGAMMGRPGAAATPGSMMGGSGSSMGSGGMMAAPGTETPGMISPGGMMGAPGTETPGMMSPGGMMGAAGTETPGTMMGGTPVAGPMGPQQMTAQMDRMRDQLMRLASGQPTHADMVGMLAQMQGLVGTMTKQAGSLSSQDLEALTADLSEAMDDMARVMETHLELEFPNRVPMTPGPTGAY